MPNDKLLWVDHMALKDEKEVVTVSIATCARCNSASFMFIMGPGETELHMQCANPDCGQAYCQGHENSHNQARA